MGRGGHDDDEGTPYDQPLEEVEFMRSACSAAQRGEVEKLARMLERKPHLVDGDGGLGDHAGGAGGDGGLSAQVSGGLGPLHYAAREGRVECAALLIKLGADVNRATAAGGATPLHRAAYTARTGCVGSRVRRVLGGGGLGFRV